MRFRRVIFFLLFFPTKGVRSTFIKKTKYLKFKFINTLEYFGEKLFSIEPISTDYNHLFNLSEFTNSDIDDLIDLNIKGKNLDELEEELYNLCGGIVIQRDDEILVSPSCCGDLSDIYNWEDIKSNNSNEWTKIWIGHPWIFYKKIENQVQISDYSENDNPKIEDKNIRFAISLNELETNLEEMRNIQLLFQNKLSERLERKKIKNFEQVAERMGCCNR